MAVNKVVLGSETLLDLTGDTVTRDTLLAGHTAHNAAGEQIEGEYTPPDVFTGPAACTKSPWTAWGTSPLLRKWKRPTSPPWAFRVPTRLIAWPRPTKTA